MDCFNGYCTNVVAADSYCSCNVSFKSNKCIISKYTKLGWSGISCNRSHCSYNGNVVFKLGSYMCECNHGWQGNQCETSKPHTHRSTTTRTITTTQATPICRMPCENGGQCVLQADGSNICACVNGFVGIYCQKKPVTCSLNCLHGHCLLENGEQYCECNHGWGGRLCSKVLFSFLIL